MLKTTISAFKWLILRFLEFVGDRRQECNEPDRPQICLTVFLRKPVFLMFIFFFLLFKAVLNQEFHSGSFYNDLWQVKTLFKVLFSLLNDSNWLIRCRVISSTYRFVNPYKIVLFEGKGWSRLDDAI